MSVAAIPSPASRFKRSYEVEAGPLDGIQLGHYEGEAHRYKRTRLLGYHQQQPQLQSHLFRVGSPAAGSRTHALESAIANLLTLFPGMDEKVVQEVLLECGSIDAAIKRLTDLKLSSEDATVAAAVAVAGGASSASPEALARQQHLQQQPSSNGAHGSAAQAISTHQLGAPGAAALREVAHQQAAAEATAAQHPPTPDVAATTSCPTAGGAPAADPQTAEQWVSALVHEMVACKDMQEARSRAAQVLQHFERFVKQRLKDEVDARCAELAKESQVLKRAVQIQAQRAQHKALQEEQQLAELRAMVAQYQEQCRRLELSNYSLAMHLQQATGGGADMGPHNPRNPDVY